VLRGLLTEQWKLYEQLTYSTESDTVKVEKYALPMALLGQIVSWICRYVEVKK
jgi:hypothetical protein